jgi:tetratricopeptide (TPR) repeat protein
MVSAELVDVRTGARLWGDRYERPTADIVQLQDAIASDISGALRLRLTAAEKRDLGRHGTENPEAYELFLKGRYYFWKDTENGYLEAERLFNQATEKDPNFAEGYTWAAQTGGIMAVGGFVRPAEGWARQVTGSLKALALSPGLPSARFAIACRRFFFDWDWVGGERELREILAEPVDRVGGVDMRPFALLLWSTGRIDEALATMEKARLADPGNAAYPITTGDYLQHAGRLDEAVRTYRSVMADDHSDPRPQFGLAEVLKRQGDIAGAIEALRSAFELTGEDDGVRALAKAHTEKDYDAAEVIVARVRIADLLALAKGRYVSPLDLARLEAQVEEREEAFRYLEAAFAERSSGLVLLKVDPAWDRIRNDARFTDLVRRVGIP